jgi:hypothetical protein
MAKKEKNKKKLLSQPSHRWEAHLAPLDTNAHNIIQVHVKTGTPLSRRHV